MKETRARNWPYVVVPLIVVAVVITLVLLSGSPDDADAYPLF
ncbi:MAG: hypothetical protein AAF726_10260 [Planctomycetota bacterium]